MRRTSSVQSLVAIMLVCITTSGCLSLAMQREMIEDMREEPVLIEKEDRFGWDYTFDSSTAVNTIMASNETTILFDETVSKLVIEFRAQLPYSTYIEDLLEKKQMRYGMLMLNIRVQEQEIFLLHSWEARATQDYPLERFTFERVILFREWDLVVEARGYGINSSSRSIIFP